MTTDRSQQEKEHLMSNTQHDLPFTSWSDDFSASLHGKGKRFWTVMPSGNWAEDCKLGEEYARSFLACVNSGSPVPLMCWIVADMIKAGRSRVRLYPSVELTSCVGWLRSAPSSLLSFCA